MKKIAFTLAEVLLTLTIIGVVAALTVPNLMGAVEDKELAQAAIEATAQSYAPYSNFNVGAAVLFEDGVVVKGANQENAAYPSGLCAERTALFYASASRPDKAMTAIAIAAGQNGELCKNPATPCGACRQVMAQYQTKSGRSCADYRRANNRSLKAINMVLKPFNAVKVQMVRWFI